MHGFIFCRACGVPFILQAENRYTARKPASVLADDLEFVDAFDCPHCGCQNRLGSRFESFSLPAAAIETEPEPDAGDDDEDEEDEA